MPKELHPGTAGASHGGALPHGSLTAAAQKPKPKRSSGSGSGGGDLEAQLQDAMQEAMTDVLKESIDEECCIM